ncbi:MAG: hypothetical protein ACOX3N_02150 [Dethiobacteria bacterium]
MLLKKEGLSKRAVAKRLKISRDTVSKYWNCARLEKGNYGPRAKLIDPYCEGSGGPDAGRGPTGETDRPLPRLYHTEA